MDTTFVQMTDFETRDAGGGVHELEGLCVPYDIPTRKAGARPEVFRPGAFADAVAAGPGKAKIRLLDQNHAKDKRPVGVATALDERSGGLYGRFRFYDTPEGDAAYRNVREDTYGGLSIAFAPVEYRNTHVGREVLKARLGHVSLVDEPAYDDAKILAVRSAAGDDPYAIFRNPPEVDLAGLRRDDTPLSVRLRRRM